MTLTIDVPKSVEDRLALKARDAGVDLPTYARQILQAAALMPSLDQALTPIRNSFAQSGTSDNAIAEQYESEKHAARE
jgi:hypothetical protein